MEKRSSGEDFLKKAMSNEPQKGDHSIVDHRKPTWLEEKGCAAGKGVREEIQVVLTRISSDLDGSFDVE